METIKKFFIHPFSIIFFSVILFIISSLEALMRIGDPDFWWHIKTGEWILNNGEIPKVDVLSWWGEGKDLVWVAHQWSADVLMSIMHDSWMGLFGLKIFSFVLFILLVLLTTYYGVLHIRKSNISPLREKLITILLGIANLLTWQWFLEVRPQILSFSLIILMGILLFKDKKWWAVLVAIIGINFHGGFWPIYFIMISYYLLPKLDWKPILVVLLSTFINPNGYYTFMYPVYGLMDKTMRFYISEWAPNKLFVDEMGWFLGAVLLILILLPKKKMSWWDIATVTVLSIQSIRSLRFLIFIPLFVIPIVLSYLDYEKIFTFLKKIMKIILQKEKLSFSMNNMNMVTVIINVVVIGIIAFYGFLNLPAVLNMEVKDIPGKAYPHDIITFLQENPQYQNRIMNHYNIGGWLLYNNIPTFVDGRSDPFINTFNKGKGNLEDYNNTINFLSDDPIEFFEKYDIQNIIWKRNTPFYYYIIDRSDFTILFESETSDYIIIKYTP